MAKKPVALDGLLNTESRPTDTGIPQRGAGQGAIQEKKPAKRPSEKRLTLALDGKIYKSASGFTPPKLTDGTRRYWKLRLRNTLSAQMRSYVIM